MAHDLHKAGVTWSLYSWSRCLEHAFDAAKHKFLEMVLAIFNDVYCADDVTEEFVLQVLPLMFDMLKLYKVSTYACSVAAFANKEIRVSTCQLMSCDADAPDSGKMSWHASSYDFFVFIRTECSN